MGVDELHIDPVWGKTGGDAGEARLIQSNLPRAATDPPRHGPYFPHNWGAMEAVLPVVSGGLSTVILPQICDLFGPYVMIQLNGMPFIWVAGYPFLTAPSCTARRPSGTIATSASGRSSSKPISARGRSSG